MITKYQLILIVLVVTVAIVVMNPSYYRALQSFYRTISKIPKVVILIGAILTAIGIKIAIPKVPFDFDNEDNINIDLNGKWDDFNENQIPIQIPISNSKSASTSESELESPSKQKTNKQKKVKNKDGTRYKRNVSAATKRLVAAKQAWKCGYYSYCHRMLDETFEVDHIVPLYKGGSNDMSNLMALDPICHRKKTRADRMGIPIKDYLQKEINERGTV